MSSRTSLIIDAWTREAEVASQWMEDLESRVKNSNFEQWSPVNSQSKLKELCVKLDRLESLLRNPPSKPILTEEYLNFRWTMLSDIQQRTRAVARNLYASASNNRKRSIPVTDTKEPNESLDFSEQDTVKNLSPKDEAKLLTRLLRSEDSNKSVDQIQTTYSLQKGCFTLCLILGVVILTVRHCFPLHKVMICLVSTRKSLMVCLIKIP